MDADQVKAKDEHIQKIQELRKHARVLSNFLFDIEQGIASRLHPDASTWAKKQCADGLFRVQKLTPTEAVSRIISRTYKACEKTKELLSEVECWLNLANIELSQDFIRKAFSSTKDVTERIYVNHHLSQVRITRMKCRDLANLIANKNCSQNEILGGVKYPESVSKEQISIVETFFPQIGENPFPRFENRNALLSLEASKAIHLIATTPYIPSQGRLFPPPNSESEETIDKHIAHSVDFRSVHWLGENYIFTKNQALCFEVLWGHWKQKTPAIGHDAIIVEAGLSDKAKLIQVFDGGNHPAWGTLIQTVGKGIYQLPEISD